MDENEFSLENRILCSDGTCIGVIGQDGICRVCGLKYQADGVLANASSPPEERNTPSQIEDGSENEKQEIKSEPEEKDAISEALEPANRICCLDDMCIGIIGKDGKCGICGKPR